MAVQFSDKKLEDLSEPKNLIYRNGSIVVWEVTIDGVKKHVVTDQMDEQLRLISGMRKRWNWKQKIYAIGLAEEIARSRRA